MLADELFKKIWSLPPMPYRYEDENGNCRYPILGYADSYPTAIKRPNDYHGLLDEIINLYDKENLTDDDKKALSYFTNILSIW